MKNIDYILHSVPDLLKSTKNNEFKKQFIETSSSLLNFMKENNLLINCEPFDEDGNLKLDIEVYMSNVSEDGIELFKNKVISGWFNYLSKSTDPDKYQNISRLEKGLAKIRGK
ncbi:hypothetical protein JHU04_004432 [Brenneria sp. 4F2]|nr:hypothetical protein [Brenneria bubanii]